VPMATLKSMTADAARLQVNVERARHTGYAVREMRSRDAEDIASVHVKVWRQTYVDLVPEAFLGGMDSKASADRWREILAQDPGDQRRLVGISPSQEIVAIATSGPSRDDNPPAELELRAINVLAAHHGTGLADLLMDALIGMQAASLWVLHDNARARTFYSRYGFRPDGATKVHEPTSAVEVRLVRDLVTTAK
jgi:ribosomal protein S18 acetylase RimI-like enzyme